MAAKDFSVHICFENKTGRDDFVLVVFHKPSAEQSECIVWRSVATQSRARFWYNSCAEVAVSYEAYDVEIESGPFPAPSGSRWNFTQDHPSFAGRLKEDISPTHKEEINAVILKNVKPIAWNGRPINCLLYRNGYMFAMQKSTPPNSTVHFPLSHKLAFGIVNSHVEPGSTLTLPQIQYHWCINMEEYSACRLLTVSVEFNKCTGEFVFSEKQHC